MDASGFTGGLQAGGNWQKGSVVFGIEVDVSSLNLTGSRSASGVTPGDAFTHTVSSTFDTSWLATARGRLGLSLSSLLIYATAGIAVTDVHLAVAYKDTQGVAMDAGNRDIKAGIVVGGGVEWALSRNWSVKGEYLFVDFGAITAFGSIGNPATGPANPFAVSSDLSTHIARVGLNYKF
jgi:outer membrane immunogenic protein